MNKHDIDVTIDYRVAYTVLQGMKSWVQKMENILDEAAATAGDELPCRRNTDRRKMKDRRSYKPEEEY